jgi:hypothetical protein
MFSGIDKIVVHPELHHAKQDCPTDHWPIYLHRLAHHDD